MNSFPTGVMGALGGRLGKLCCTGSCAFRGLQNLGGWDPVGNYVHSPRPTPIGQGSGPKNADFSPASSTYTHKTFTCEPLNDKKGLKYVKVAKKSQLLGLYSCSFFHSSP